MRRTLLLSLLMAIWLPVASVPAQSKPDAGFGGGTLEPVVDLDFRGGTVADYAGAIRRAVGEVNLIIAPDAAAITVAPVQLRRATVTAALDLIDGLREGGFVTNVAFKPGSAAALPVWRVEARSTGRSSIFSKEEPEMTNVWSLAEIIDGGTSADDVLSAVEAALGLFGDSFPEAQLRFHPPTRILICRAQPQQLETIRSLLQQLSTAPRSVDWKARVERCRSEAATAIRDLESKVSDLLGVQREVVEWQTRAELYEAEIHKLRDETIELRQRLLRLSPGPGQPSGAPGAGGGA